jgi:D-glycero-alpha-D-manno-heptose-7-phosphate kinase
MAMFFTGYSREASGVLKDQNLKTLSLNKTMIDNLLYTKDLGYRSRDALLEGNIDKYGHIMHEHWMHKLKRSKDMSNPKINKWYNLAIENGAIGGKLVGAGGGGFLLFVCDNKKKLTSKMSEIGLSETKFNFENEGAKIINQ